MKINKSLLTGSTTMLILSLLRDGDKYGYEMVALLASYSDNTFQLKEGTLYPLLHTLEKNKYVIAYMAEGPNGRERKYYHITKQGLSLFDEKAGEWRVFSEKVNQVLQSGSPAPQKI